jgi:hypothetical protein
VSVYEAARIEKPKWFKLAPLKNGRTQRQPYVIGFDSEADKGKPFLFQFATPDSKVDMLPVARTKGDSLSVFLWWLYEHCTDRHSEYIVFGWNLNYEWTQLFRDLPRDLVQLPEFTFITNEKLDFPLMKVSVLNDKRYSATIEFPRSKVRIKLIDGMAFFVMSLDEASKMVSIGKKLPKPKKFDRKMVNDPAFRAYAAQDAKLTQKLGEIIVSYHEQSDVRQCISAPMLAARTFRRQYLRSDIPLPPPDLEQAGLNSYHGGKNGFYLNKPQRLHDVWSYDIVSAYPEAMQQLPCIEHGEWSYHDGVYKPSTKATHSLCHVRYVYVGCRYDPLYASNGTRLQKGFGEAWITSYELDSMLDNREITLTTSEWWTFNSDCDCGSTSALRAYVDTFFTLKRTTKDVALKQFAKLMLNSLYGKFYQKVARGRVGEIVLSDDLSSSEFVITDPDVPYDYTAGGLYHPPIASLITGFVRAKIHNLEHKYNALMTSTDGFFATREPDPSDIGTELGMLEAQQGTLIIWRERLYIFTPRRVAAEKRKVKFAKHGFRGSLQDLRHMPVKAGRHDYYATELTTLKRQGLLRNGERTNVGEIVERPFYVEIPTVPP